MPESAHTRRPLLLRALSVSLTFLPAVLALSGRRVFWPKIPRPAAARENTGAQQEDAAPSDAAPAAPSGIWERVAYLVARTLRRIAVGVGLVLLVG